MNRFLFVAGAVVLAVVTRPYHAAAQRSYPMLMSVEPVAVQVGTTAECVVKSRYTMEDAYEVWVSGAGVSGEVVLPEAKPDQKKTSPLQALTVRFTVSDDALPGVRDFRIATPNGISTTGQLVVAIDPVVVESGDNNTIEQANAVELPATICGRIERAEDVDYFKFHAAAGQTIRLHVRCMRLQDRIHDLQQHADPLISIRNAAGSTIAASDNVFAADPILCHTFAEEGDYFLELRDVRYQGNDYWCYSIESNSQPHVQVIDPLAISRQNPQSVRAVGYAMSEGAGPGVRIADGAVVSFAAGVESDPVKESVLQQVVLSPGDDLRQPVDAVVFDGPIVDETTEPNNDVTRGQLVSVPSGITGRIESENDIDCFQFEAKKGQRFSFEVIARRAGSSLDSHLRILDQKGNQQQLNDDVRIGKRNFADSQIENWTVPADGTYAIEIRDVHLRGGADFVYFIDVTPSEPHFSLSADTGKTPLSPGTSGVVYVRVEKKNGFDGEIQLAIEGLPDGVTATCGKILGGSHTDGCIVLTAAADAKPLAQPVRIYGTATLDRDGQSTTLESDAVIYQETYQPGGGRGHWPVESHVVSIATPGDVHAVDLQTHELTLKRGESVSIDVEIERAEGFDKNVTLEVAYQHLSQIYGDPLPKGVKVDAGNSKLLLTAGATKGKITLTAAKDAALAEQQVFTVMANVSINFVMKATYASAPVRITVVE